MDPFKDDNVVLVLAGRKFRSICEGRRRHGNGVRRCLGLSTREEGRWNSGRFLREKFGAPGQSTICLTGDWTGYGTVLACRAEERAMADWL